MKLQNFTGEGDGVQEVWEVWGVGGVEISDKGDDRELSPTSIHKQLTEDL